MPNNRFGEIITKYHEFVVNLSRALIISLIFLSGVGRYRLVLVVVFYHLVIALLSVIRPELKVKYVLLPVTLIGLYFDIKEGPFFPIFERNSLLFAAVIALISDNLIKTFAEKKIAMFADNKLFLICPACGKSNKDLVEKCASCLYEKGSQIVIYPSASVSPAFEGDKLPSKVLSMLRLETNEVILFHAKITSHPVYINDVKNVRLHFLLTTKNLILLDYYRINFTFSNTWREIDTIPVSTINIIEAKMEKFTLSPQPLISISTSLNDIYKIVFYSKNNCKTTYEKIIQIVKKINPSVEGRMNMPEDDTGWKDIWKSKI